MGLPLSHNISLGIATCLLAQLPLQTLQADHGAMCDAFVTHFKLRFLEIIFSLCHLDVANVAQKV